MEAGALEAEARGVAYVLTVFTAGVNELLLADFIETVGKAPRQGLISRRRPGLRGPNHSTSVMAFGAKGSENQGRRCRCSAAGTHRALLTGGVRPEGLRRGGQSPPRAPGAPPRRQPGMRNRQPFSLALQNTAVQGRHAGAPREALPLPHAPRVPRSSVLAPSRAPARGAPSPGSTNSCPAPPGHRSALTPAPLPLVPRRLLRRPGALLGAASCPAAGGARSHARPRL